MVLQLLQFTFQYLFRLALLPRGFAGWLGVLLPDLLLNKLEVLRESLDLQVKVVTHRLDLLVELLVALLQLLALTDLLVEVILHGIYLVLEVLLLVAASLVLLCHFLHLVLQVLDDLRCLLLPYLLLLNLLALLHLELLHAGHSFVELSLLSLHFRVHG